MNTDEGVGRVDRFVHRQTVGEDVLVPWRQMEKGRSVGEGGRFGSNKMGFLVPPSYTVLRKQRL